MTGVGPGRRGSMKRPCVVIGLWYLAGVLLAWAAPWPAWVGAGLAGLIAGLAGLPRTRRWLPAGLLVLAGWGNLTLRTALIPADDLRRLAAGPPALATVAGVVRVAPQEHFHRRADRETVSTTVAVEVRTLALAGGVETPARGRVVVFTKAALPAIFAGQTVRVEGVLGPPPGPVAPGLFDYRALLANQGIYHELQADSAAAWRVVAAPAGPPWTDRFQAWGRRVLALGRPVEDQTLRLEYALTLGWKAGLPETVAEPFVRAATFHIFAVDGLRIALVSGLLIFALRRLRLTRTAAGAVALPLVCFYAAMTGWPASAVRAIVMLAVVVAGALLRRPGDLVNSLFAAAVLILLGEPRELFQAGFQLSFLVVLCLILIHPVGDRFAAWLAAGDPLLPVELVPRWRRAGRAALRWVAEAFLGSVAAWLASIPLVAWYFHLVTPVSGPANLLAVPLCGLVLLLNLTSLAFGAWCPVVSVGLNHAAWQAMRGIETSSAWFADLPRAYWYVAAPTPFGLALYYALLLTVFTGWLWRRPGRQWKLGAAGAVVGLWLGLALTRPPVVELTVLPLHGGHAVYARLPGAGQDCLVNSGNELAVTGLVQPYLRAQGVNHPAHFLLTQADILYAGGAVAVLREFRPREMAWGGPNARSPAYVAVAQYARTNSARLGVATLRDGDRLGPWEVVVPGGADAAARAEDHAVVLRGRIQGSRVWLLSGLGAAGQRALLAGTNDLRADIVVAGPPAQGEPLGAGLLAAMQPRLVILADARDPTPRRVSVAAGARLERLGVPVFRTRVSDAVTVRFRPDGWEARGMDGRTATGSFGAEPTAP